MTPFVPLCVVVCFVTSVLILSAGVSGSTISVRQNTNCPESCYPGPPVDPSNTTYYRILCTSNVVLTDLISCFSCGGADPDPPVADLEGRCANAGVTLTVNYFSNNTFTFHYSYNSSVSGSASGGASGNSPTVTSTSHSTTSTGILSPSFTPPPDYNKPPIGAIIGGTVGGGVSLILLFYIFKFRSRLFSKEQSGVQEASGEGKNNRGPHQGSGALLPEPEPTPQPTPGPPPSASDLARSRIPSQDVQERNHTEGTTLVSNRREYRNENDMSSSSALDRSDGVGMEDPTSAMTMLIEREQNPNRPPPLYEARG